MKYLKFLFVKVLLSSLLTGCGPVEAELSSSSAPQVNEEGFVYEWVSRTDSYVSINGYTGEIGESFVVPGFLDIDGQRCEVVHVYFDSLFSAGADDLKTLSVFPSETGEKTETYWGGISSGGVYFPRLESLEICQIDIFYPLGIGYSLGKGDRMPALTEYRLGEGVERVGRSFGDMAFGVPGAMRSLKRLTLSKDVAHVDDLVMHMTRFEEFYVEEGNATFQAGAGPLYSTQGELVSVPPGYGPLLVVQDGTTSFKASIGSGYNWVEDVVLPSSVEYVAPLSLRGAERVFTGYDYDELSRLEEATGNQTRIYAKDQWTYVDGKPVPLEGHTNEGGVL